MPKPKKGKEPLQWLPFFSLLAVFFIVLVAGGVLFGSDVLIYCLGVLGTLLGLFIFAPAHVDWISKFWHMRIVPAAHWGFIIIAVLVGLGLLVFWNSSYTIVLQKRQKI